MIICFPKISVSVLIGPHSAKCSTYETDLLLFSQRASTLHGNLPCWVSARHSTAICPTQQMPSTHPHIASSPHFTTTLSTRQRTAILLPRTTGEHSKPGMQIRASRSSHRPTSPPQLFPSQTPLATRSYRSTNPGISPTISSLALPELALCHTSKVPRIPPTNHLSATPLFATSSSPPFDHPTPLSLHSPNNLRSARDAIMRDYKTRLTHAQKGPHDQIRFFEIGEEARLKAAAAYAALLPSPEQQDEPVVQAWLMHAVPGMSSLWDLLRASAAAALQTEFAWMVAGPAICYLRAHQAGGKGPVMVVPELFGALKVGKVKKPGERKRSRRGCRGGGRCGGAAWHKGRSRTWR